MTTNTHIAAHICREVAELPDRNSPEDWPEAMLVTHAELESIVLQALEAAPALDAQGEAHGWMAIPQPMTTSRFVTLMKRAGLTSWDSRMFDLKRRIEADYGITGGGNHVE